MKEPLIVALDQGTSGLKAFAIDPNGKVSAQIRTDFPPRRPAEGCSEYTAEELCAAQQQVLNRLLEEVGPQRVVALAVCSQRSSIVLWDKKTGCSLAPVLTWEDGRSYAEAENALISQESIHKQTGLFKTPYFSAPKIAWCLAHFPAVKQVAAAGTLCAAPVASYFIWKLTQGRVFAADPTLAQRTLLWDIHTGAWSEALCQAFGVRLSCLPDVLPTCGNYGTYTYNGVKIPIRVCVADQQAALNYHGITDGQTAVNYGTGAFVLHPIGRQAQVLPGLLSSVAVDSSFLWEGPVFAAGSVLTWLTAQGLLSPQAHVDEAAQAAQHPVRFLPAFGGLGAPYWNYRVSPVIENLSPHTRAADFVAGAVQGVAHLVADIVDYIRQNGQTVTRVQVSGGMARCTYLLQTQADLLQCPLAVCAETESTVLGAALLAAQSAGWNVTRWTPAKQTIFPRISASKAQVARAEWKEFIARICPK